MTNQNDIIYIIIAEIEFFLDSNNIEYQSTNNQIVIYPQNHNQITINVDNNIKIKDLERIFIYDNDRIEAKFYTFLNNLLEI
ncbi:MAG: hypothetical protein CMD88_01810 [Gammaproteobacteria bacterium]|nr:hypothetical protein [Gammaproteobacteria bacterium]|tara:strand:- start:4094 stop:4339 length:246 start_codon:yes stop_codon:yes gene_type:complete